MDTILVVNAGSSSVKFQVYEIAGGGELKCLIKGQMDGIGASPRLRAAAPGGKSMIDRSFAADEVADLPGAMQRTGAWLREAHTKALTDGFRGTDDGVLVERLGYPVRLVPGSPDNLKVTTMADLAQAEQILRRRMANDRQMTNDK